MKDRGGAILYVGKAKVLRNRLITYFQPATHEVGRIELMVGQVDHFDVILSDTEEEALILECTLIKKHRPRFNVRLKDDKTYPYIRISMEETYPRLEWTRRVRKDGARYFGPFPSGWAAKTVLRFLTETYQFRDCSDNVFRHRTRPCLLHQMGKCSAPCVALISPGDYRAQIQEAISVLEGKGDALLEELERGMKQAAEKQEFEQAAYYRDQLMSLRAVIENQRLVDAGSDRNRDVAALERQGTEASVALLLVRGGKVLNVRHYALQNSDPSQSDAEVLSEALAQHYFRMREEEAKEEGTNLPVATECLSSILPKDAETVSRSFHVRFVLPETPGDERLISVAKANAKHALELREKRAGGHGIEALEDVQSKLHLRRLPARIECYDISNFQGEDSVASRVVFIDGAPEKALYRRYKIRTVEGQDDFAMMREVLARRLAKAAEDPLPDLLLVDGGKGQLSQAIAILGELGAETVELASLAKARTESNFRDTEVKSSMERIFLPNRKNPVMLGPHTEAYRLLVHVRDEAHRFAITYHRLLRDKRSLGQEGA